jgi:hypothetical protein
MHAPDEYGLNDPGLAPAAALMADRARAALTAQAAAAGLDRAGCGPPLGPGHAARRSVRVTPAGHTGLAASFGWQDPATQEAPE